MTLLLVLAGAAVVAAGAFSYLAVRRIDDRINAALADVGDLDRNA